MAYDSGRNAIWLDGGNGNVYLVQLDGSKEVSSVSLGFAHPQQGSGLIDGLAYDGTDDILYISYDGAISISHYESDGTYIGDFSWAGEGCFNSGLAIGGDLLYQGADGCTHVWVVDKSDTSTLVFDFSTAVGDDPSFRDEDLECDINTFASDGKHVMWSVEAYEPRRALAFEIPFDSCGSGGLPPPPDDCSNEGVLTANPGVINLGQTTDITQKIDTCSGLTGNIISWTVSEIDGDICGANSLPEAIPASGSVTKEYPTEFSLLTSGGDGICDTGDIGKYVVGTQVEIGGVVQPFTDEFDTSFFVVPESPIGAAALVASSLAALAAYMLVRKGGAARGGSTSSIGE
jgi:hypothetical protein